MQNDVVPSGEGASSVPVATMSETRNESKFLYRNILLLGNEIAMLQK